MILVVDDNDLITDLIKDIINSEEKGHFVDVVKSGEEALRLASLRYYALIFMDLKLKGMCGVDTAIAIHKLPAPFCDVPIVALSGFKPVPGIRRWDDAGFVDLLTKPFSVKELMEIVSAYDPTSK